MDLTALTRWIGDNQPLINFGLLVGAVVYTIITGLILRVSGRQLRATFQPALTLKRSSIGANRNVHQPYLLLGGLEFQNSGHGAAINVIARVAVHRGGSVRRFPKFDTETVTVPNAVQAGEDWAIPRLLPAVEGGGTEEFHEYEVFISYDSIVGAKYITHLSIGLAGTIEAFYAGERSLMRRVRIWTAIRWRFYSQWIPIWRKVYKDYRQRSGGSDR
jgi:hypothetical protein